MPALHRAVKAIDGGEGVGAGGDAGFQRHTSVARGGPLMVMVRSGIFAFASYKPTVSSRVHMCPHKQMNTHKYAHTYTHMNKNR